MERFTSEDSLAAVTPGSEDFDVPPHFTPDDSADKSRAVQAMLADHKRLLDRHANLMWSDRKNVKAPNGYVVPTDKRVKRSGFDGRLPFMGPYLGYWIQNRQIFEGKQRVVKLSDVPEVKKDPKGVEVELRAMVRLALAIMDQQILEADPLRCKVCVDFRGNTEIELMAHFRRAHPKELDELVDGIERLRAEEDADENPPVPTPDRGKKKQTFRASA